MKNKLATWFIALFFGVLLCLSIYGMFFAEMEGTVDFWGKEVSPVSLLRIESAMCFIVIMGFGWIVYTETKNK